MRFRRCTYACAHEIATQIRRCGRLRDLDSGRRIHASLTSSPHLRRGDDGYLSNLLVEMYGRCGSIRDARRAFDEIAHKTVFSWTVIVAAYAHNGHSDEAFLFFRAMDLEGVSPNKVTLITILRACSRLDECCQIQARARSLGLEADTNLATALVTTFARLGSLVHARRVFEDLGIARNVVSWTVMIWAYAQRGRHDEAFELYHRMDCEPNDVTFMAVMDACSCAEDLERGRKVHRDLIDAGFESDVVLQICLVTMYGRCGCAESAWNLFLGLEERSVVAWNSMISAYADNRFYKESLKLYETMLHEGRKPNKITYLAVLGACQSVSDARKYVASFELELDRIAQNAAITTYARCGSLREATLVFDSIQWKNDIVSWNAMIAGFAHHDKSEQALEYFRRMEIEGVKPNLITYLGVLVACSRMKDLARGREICARILQETGDQIREPCLSNALINMYGKCGRLGEAQDEFANMVERDFVSWNTLMAAHAQHGSGRKTLEIFRQMDLEGFRPDQGSFVAAIDACGSIPSLALGRTIHKEVTASPDLEHDPGLATALVVMYGKCGSMHDAKSVFWSSSSKTLLTWSNLIAVCAQHGRESEALGLFREMQLQGTSPDALTFITLIAACSRRGFVRDGVFLFRSMVEDYGIAASKDHFGGMIDLLGRAGWLREAEELMESTPHGGFAMAGSIFLAACHVHGDSERGIRVASDTIELDLENSVSYITVSSMYANAVFYHLT